MLVRKPRIQRGEEWMDTDRLLRGWVVTNFVVLALLVPAVGMSAGSDIAPYGCRCSTEGIRFCSTEDCDPENDEHCCHSEFWECPANMCGVG